MYTYNWMLCPFYYMIYCIYSRVYHIIYICLLIISRTSNLSNCNSSEPRKMYKCPSQAKCSRIQNSSVRYQISHILHGSTINSCLYNYTQVRNRRNVVLYHINRIVDVS